MSNRIQDYGMDVAISNRLRGKYDPQTEAQVVGWMNQLTGSNLPTGRENLQSALQNGQILVKLINVILDKTANLSPAAQSLKRPIKVNTMNAPFKHMENINNFLNAANAYGLQKESLFQTVDLYEARNMAQVINTILQLGSECQRNGFQGPVCGPKPTTSNKRNFSLEQLRSGECTIGLQAGTNKFASQKGMTMGTQRHISDIKCDNMTAEGAAVIGLQMGTNQFASQKGMSMGAVRHIADIRCDDLNREGCGHIGLQMGTNKFASQKGMRIGATRHIADIPVDQMDEKGMSEISLQYGSNKGASQSGMRIGAIRHINDITCGVEPNINTSNDVSLQMGLGKDKAANQSGMSFGARRHINDMH